MMYGCNDDNRNVGVDSVNNMVNSGVAIDSKLDTNHKLNTLGSTLFDYMYKHELLDTTRSHRVLVLRKIGDDNSRYIRYQEKHSGEFDEYFYRINLPDKEYTEESKITHNELPVGINEYIESVREEQGPKKSNKIQNKIMNYDSHTISTLFIDDEFEDPGILININEFDDIFEKEEYYELLLEEDLSDYKPSSWTTHTDNFYLDDVLYEVVGNKFEITAVEDYDCGDYPKYEGDGCYYNNTKCHDIQGSVSNLDVISGTHTLRYTCGVELDLSRFEVDVRFEAQIEPSTPELNEPADGELIEVADGEVELSWEYDYGTLDITSKIQVSKEVDFSNIIYTNEYTINSRNQTYALSFSELDGQDEYYWRIQGTNEYGTTNWSATGNFIVADLIDNVIIMGPDEVELNTCEFYSVYIDGGSGYYSYDWLIYRSGTLKDEASGDTYFFCPSENGGYSTGYYDIKVTVEDNVTGDSTYDWKYAIEVTDGDDDGPGDPIMGIDP